MARNRRYPAKLSQGDVARYTKGVTAGVGRAPTCVKVDATGNFIAVFGGELEHVSIDGELNDFDTKPPRKTNS
jgi:hypothetical protein